jgi:hypothetical protein
VKTKAPPTTAEFSLFDGLAACARAGEPFQVQFPCPDALRRVLIGQIERLCSETGKPVHVTFVKAGANGGAR